MYCTLNLEHEFMSTWIVLIYSTSLTGSQQSYTPTQLMQEGHVKRIDLPQEKGNLPTVKLMLSLSCHIIGLSLWVYHQ